MTVLVWCSWATDGGGLERIAVHLANGLARSGWQALLVGPLSRAPSLVQQIAPQVLWIDYCPQHSVFGLLDTARVLSRLVREHRVDVISAHGSVYALLGVTAPILWTEHALRFKDKFVMAGPRRLAWRQVGARLRSGHWQLVSVSRCVRDYVCRHLHLPPDTGAVIYNGVPDEASLRALRRPALQSPYQIGFIGRLEDEKRPLDIFEVDRRLLERGLACEWHVFGTGSLLSEMCNRAAVLGPGRIHVHGMTSTERAFAQIDLLVVPSRAESLSMVVLEARVARRLTVAWNVTGIPEAAGEQTLLVDPPFDLRRFADAVAETLRGGRVPPPASTGPWSLERMVCEYDAVLRSMVEHGSPLCVTERGELASPLRS